MGLGLYKASGENGDLAGWGGKKHQTKLTPRTMKVKCKNDVFSAKTDCMLTWPSQLPNIESTNIICNTIQPHRQQHISRPKMGVHASIYGNLKNK